MTRPPDTRRGDTVDVLHGETVSDPYRWLEDTDSDETAEWVKRQNEVTAAYLEELPGRAEIRDRLSQLWRVPRYGVPFEHGGRWFFTRHDAHDDQPTLRVADAPDDDGRVLLDLNTLSDDGTVALTTWTVTPDGSRVVYATSAAGSDWMTLRVIDVETGGTESDVVEWSKWVDAAWLPDGSGFFYGRLDTPTPGNEYLQTNEPVQLHLHRLGTPQHDDTLFYADLPGRREPYAWTIDHGRWLVIATYEGTNPTSIVMVVDLHSAGREIVPLLPQPEWDARVVGNDGATFFVLTDADAPMKRVVAIDLDHPEREHWREVIGEGSDAILDVAQVGDRLVTHSLHDASSRLQIWSTDGEHLRDVDLPPYVTVTELSGGEGPVLHFGMWSFIDPASVWSCDVTTGQVRKVRDAGLPIDESSIVVSRASAPSEDGTEVPMFLVRRRDVTPDGDVPTMLYGYGGFDIPMTPTFNAGKLVWVERGGLLVVANLRGGGEFGKEWYDAGKLAHKQAVFDDFVGCARWLATSGWTRAERIVVNGGSNGGLLVGATMTQHPEVIGAAVPEVGVMDMLRFHKFTIGWAWTGDVGDPDDPAQYQWLRAYSPLHAIREGTSYPPTLVMTGDHDDRVVPGHSFKFAAALQHAQAGEAPVLIRIETSAGHGAGMPVSKQIEARADMLAFCESAVGLASSLGEVVRSTRRHSDVTF
jgi:prolyl oligopeptidase